MLISFTPFALLSYTAIVAGLTYLVIRKYRKA
jgi:hypothetical protein